MKGRAAGAALGVTLGIVVAGAIACGGRKKEPGWKPHYEKTSEITALWTQIRQWRSEAKMELEPPAQMMQMIRGRSASDLRAKTCPADHPVPTTCNDICSIADNICENSERICTLADELGKGDDFAQQKCTSAKASCKEAKQKCCACSETADDAGIDAAHPGGAL